MYSINDCVIGVDSFPMTTKRIFVYGNGTVGKDIMNHLESKYPDIEKSFIDNKKMGKEGEWGVAKSNSIEVKQADLFVIGSTKYSVRFLKDLFELGIPAQHIVIPIEVFKDLTDKILAIREKRIPKKKIYPVIDVSSHCNLNCIHCDHFSPIAQKEFMDLTQFEKDIKRLSELFVEDYEIYAIGLEGGEPLLNPNLKEYIKIVHNYLPQAQINILSNGILLSEMDNEFWDICRRMRVHIKLTRYPINVDYEQLAIIASKNEVVLTFSNDVVKTMNKKPINLDGDSDINLSYDTCYMGNDMCTVLKNGKIYLCTFAPYFYRMNDYFGFKLMNDQNDYIDIYEAHSAEEIMEYLCKPIPACRYCMPDECVEGIEWRGSQRVKEEWV